MIASSLRRRGSIFAVLVATCLHVPHVSAQPPGNVPNIYWRDHQFSPGVDQDVLPANLRGAAVRPNQPEYYFVQLRGPVTRADKAKVEATGARLMNYVPENAYIVRMDAATKEKVDALDEVRWTGLFEPGFRLSSTLRTRFEGLAPPPEQVPRVLRADADADADALAVFPSVQLSVDVFQGASLPAVRRSLERLGATVLQTSESKRGARLLVDCPSDRALGISGVPGVRWIEEYRLHKLHNDTSRGVMNVGPVWTTHALQGAGQVVGVADTGLDSGVDDATMHTDFAGRIGSLFSWPVGSYAGVTNVGADDGVVDLDSGHGTHVSGSVLGDGAVSGGTFSGVAPQASIVMQAIEQFTDFGDPDTNGYALTGIPFDLNDLFQQSYDAGARIHTNSWGSDAAGNYDAESQEVDEFVWDHPDMLILFSAGNAGADSEPDSVIDLGSVGSPGTAKNCITVGASENNRPAILQTYGLTLGATIDADRIADNAAGMAAFSSRGPANADTASTADDRIKPDLVSPGTMVASVRTQFAPNTIWFQDDMEGGVNGWTATGAWAQITADSSSPTTSWHDSPGGNYAASVNSSLTSPVIDLSGGAGLGAKAVEFKVHWDMGTGDEWFLEVSKDGGASWIGIPGIGGTQANWELFSISLGQVGTWANSANFRVRFRFVSDADANVGDGLFIDDFRVSEGAFLSSLLSDHGIAAAGSANDTNYVLCNGTSMATPLAAGAAALTRQYYTDTVGVSSVSAALIRATLVNGAFDMNPGQYGAGATQEMAAAPNNVEGWGRLDLERALFPAAPAQLDHVEELAGLETGETHTYLLNVTDDSVPLAVTMVYHDFPGAALVNHLDLTMTAPGSTTTIFPNGLAALDTRNNVERIVIPNPVVGTYTITVNGQNVPQGPQPYAMVTTAGGTLTDRDPVDVMLVLDMSGSMLSPACPTCDPKLDVLQDSVELFIQLYTAVAVPNDRLGVHYFRTNITDFDVGGNVLLPVIDNAAAMISDVQGQVTNSSALTAMGGGIQSAIDRLTDPSRPLGMVLFTDGMQNVNPMVIETDTSPPPGAFDLHIDDQAGKPNSNISATSPPTQLNSALGISVNTIGVGAMPSFQDLLDKISQKTAGVTKITTAPDDDLRRFFVEELIDVLRGFSPQLVDYRKGTLATGHTAESFQVNGGGKKIVLKLSWQRGDEMQFRVEHDGQDLTALGKIIKGEFYRIYSLDLPARVRGRSVTSDGTWTMHIEGGERGRYEAACILEEPALKYGCHVTAKTLHAGQPLFLRANLTVEGRPMDGRVKAIISHPPTSIATLLAQIESPQDPNGIKPEPGASRAQAKLQQLLLNPNFYKQLKPVVTTVPLTRQRDGSFVAKFDGTKVAGGYTIEFQMEAKHPELGSFQRTESCTRFIPMAPPDAGGSDLFATRVKKVIDGQAFLLHIAPRDKLDNMLGPDAANKIRVDMRPGDVASDCVQDLGDGSYLVPLFVPGSGDSQMEVRVGGHVVFAGKLSSIVR